MVGGNDSRKAQELFDLLEVQSCNSVDLKLRDQCLQRRNSYSTMGGMTESSFETYDTVAHT